MKLLCKKVISGLAGAGLLINIFTSSAYAQVEPPANTVSGAVFDMCIIETNLATTPDKLQQGDTGPDVTKLQQALNTESTINVFVDGSYGSQTVNAMRQWQSLYGLPADGMFGPQTKAVMLQALGQNNTWCADGGYLAASSSQVAVDETQKVAQLMAQLQSLQALYTSLVASQESSTATQNQSLTSALQQSFNLQPADDTTSVVLDNLLDTEEVSVDFLFSISVPSDDGLNIINGIDLTQFSDYRPGDSVNIAVAGTADNHISDNTKVSSFEFAITVNQSGALNQMAVLGIEGYIATDKDDPYDIKDYFLRPTIMTGYLADYVLNLNTIRGVVNGRWIDMLDAGDIDSALASYGQEVENIGETVTSAEFTSLDLVESIKRNRAIQLGAPTKYGTIQNVDTQIAFRPIVVNNNGIMLVAEDLIGQLFGDQKDDLTAFALLFSLAAVADSLDITHQEVGVGADDNHLYSLAVHGNMSNVNQSTSPIGLTINMQYYNHGQVPAPQEPRGDTVPVGELALEFLELSAQELFSAPELFADKADVINLVLESDFNGALPAAIIYADENGSARDLCTADDGEFYRGLSIETFLDQTEVVYEDFLGRDGTGCLDDNNNYDFAFWAHLEETNTYLCANPYGVNIVDDKPRSVDC